MSDVIKARAEDRFLLMVAYSPNRMPHRGADGKVDVVSPDVLEKACWRFTDNGLKVGLNHEPGHENVGRIVENGIYRGPDWSVKTPRGSAQVIKSGDWLVGIRLSKKGWKMYKSGRITGVSPQGKAGRMAPTAATLKRIGVTHV